MAKITIEELSKGLKDIIEENGLTEAQVTELLKSYYTKTEIGTLSSLSTTNKTIVGAINELFQSANNGKQLIASAIGEPLSSNDTFSAMSSDINSLLSTFKTNMMNNGVTVNSSDRFKSLIDKIATLADSEGKGIQFAEGAVDRIKISDEYYKGVIKTIDININFNPTMIVVCADISNNQLDIDNISVSSTVAYDKNNRAEIRGSLTGSVVFVYIQNITQTSFDLCVSGTVTFKNFKWYAIGVGEEDTTLRDSLADILENKGVDVTEEDDMASLIGKVTTLADSKSKDMITASSLPSTVVNGQVVLIPKVETTLPIVLANKSHMKLSTETEICVSTTEIANNFTFNSTLSNIKISYYLNNAIQYSGGKNNLIDGYLGVNGVWSQFSKSGIIFYLNGVDGEQISGASSSNNTSVYTGYYINTSNTGGMLNINTNVMGSTINAYVCFKKAYDLTNYSKLEINYVKDSTWAPNFSFGFSKNYTYDNVSLAKSVRVNSSSPASGTVSVDVSSLTGVYYFAITGTGSTSKQYMLNVSSIILS